MSRNHFPLPLQWFRRSFAPGVALLCLMGSSCTKPKAESTLPGHEAGVPVTVAKVELVPLDRTIPVWGTLFAKDEATVAAEVEGRVEKTMAEFGDRIKAGQELALIDTASYEAFANQAAANVARARANAANADQDLKRVRELRSAGIASASDLDKAIATADQAQAELQAAESAEVVARLNLARSHVRAPFDAAVADRIAIAGDFMKIGSPMFRVVNDSVLKLIVQAPERYAGQVQKEQPLLFTVDAWPGETFQGRVFLISPAVNTSTRAFPFGALVQNPEHKLKASSYARGNLILERNVPTPMVPLEAVITFAGVTKLFVVEAAVAHARTVEVGLVRDRRQEVLSGLKAGELVVTSGQTKLYDGSKVRIKSEGSKDPSSTGVTEAGRSSKP